MKVAKVVFVNVAGAWALGVGGVTAAYDGLKRYEYAVPEWAADLEKGDYVVVSANGQYALAQVDDINDYAEYEGDLREIVDIVDVKPYERQKWSVKRKAQIFKRLQELEQEQRLLTLAMSLSAESAEAEELYKELKEL